MKILPNKWFYDIHIILVIDKKSLLSGGVGNLFLDNGFYRPSIIFLHFGSILLSLLVDIQDIPINCL
jgi:hypothetical protein